MQVYTHESYTFEYIEKNSSETLDSQIYETTISKCAHACTRLSIFTVHCKQMLDKCCSVQSANYSTRSISKGQ